MSNIQYKTTSGGTWTDVPAAAIEGTYFGMLAVERPAMTNQDGVGAPCAAIGNPRIVIRAGEMTGTGMAHWMGRFTTIETLSVTTWQTAYDPHSATWKGYTGTLFRPTWSAVNIGSTAAKTYYRDVEIIIDNVTSATWS